MTICEVCLVAYLGSYLASRFCLVASTPPRQCNFLATAISYEDASLHCIMMYCSVLYCSVLYCIVLYCIVLYCIVSYCTML